MVAKLHQALKKRQHNTNLENFATHDFTHDFLRTTHDQSPNSIINNSRRGIVMFLGKTGNAANGWGGGGGANSSSSVPNAKLN